MKTVGILIFILYYIVIVTVSLRILFYIGEKAGPAFTYLWRRITKKK